MKEVFFLSYLGENIRKYRKLKGLTINELADLSKSSVSSISLIETGKRDPTFKVILNIAQALQIDIAKLVTSPEAIVFEHSIDFIMNFVDGTVLLTGTSKSSADDIVTWSLVVNISEEGHLIEEFHFKTNNETYSCSSFYHSQLKPYFLQQRFLILLRNAVEIDTTYLETKKTGINWNKFQEIIYSFQDIIFKLQQNETRSKASID